MHSSSVRAYLCESADISMLTDMTTFAESSSQSHDKMEDHIRAAEPGAR